MARTVTSTYTDEPWYNIVDIASKVHDYRMIRNSRCSILRYQHAARDRWYLLYFNLQPREVILVSPVSRLQVEGSEWDLEGFPDLWRRVSYCFEKEDCWSLTESEAAPVFSYIFRQFLLNLCHICEAHVGILAILRFRGGPLRRSIFFHQAVFIDQHVSKIDTFFPVTTDAF